MTYGYRPENWPDFQRRLDAQGIAVADIEKVEIRPAGDDADGGAPMIDVIVTVRSGRVHTWRQENTATG